MTTHLTSWSKMSFQKKSKATASVGSPSARSLLRSKSSRGTKSDVKVDRDNNNSQESLEQEAERRRDMESKSVVPPWQCGHWAVWLHIEWCGLMSCMVTQLGQSGGGGDTISARL